MEKNIIIIILIPLISAFIGWLTNYLAIKSLFRPIKKRKFLFFEFFGLIPKRQKILSKNIAEIIENYLFSQKDILELIEKPENLKKIKSKLIPILEEKILEKIPDMFKTIATPILKNILDSQIDSILKKLIEELSNNLFENIKIKNIVYNKLINYKVENLEKIIYKIADKELKHIEYLGALIGFLVGIFQIILMIFL